VVTRDPFFLVGRTERLGFKLADLMDKRVATVSEVPTPWLCLQEDMRRAGLDPAKLDRVTGQSMASNAAALRRGEVDVVQLFQPFVEELVEAGAAHIWQAAAERGPTSYTTLYTRRSLLVERRAECERMVRALHRTLKWVDAGTGQQLAAAVAGYFPDVPQPRLASALDRYKALGLWGRDTRLPSSGYERLRAGLVSGGLVSKGTPYESAVDNTLAELVARQDLAALRR
jgi:NitT/TauT family transport system substrate-binding protein